MAKGKQEHISAQQEYDAIRAHKPVYRLEPWELCEVYAARPEVRTLTYGLLYVLMRDQPEKPFDAMLDFVNSFASEGEVRDPSKEELPPRGCREEDAYRYISNGKIMTFLHHLFTSMFDEQPSDPVEHVKRHLSEAAAQKGHESGNWNEAERLNIPSE